MTTKARRLLAITITLGSLVLAGCDPIDNLLGWHDGFKIQTTSQDIGKWFGFIIGALALGVLFLGITGANKILDGHPKGKAIILPVSIAIAVLGTVLLPDRINDVVAQQLPASFVLDWVLSKAVHIDLKTADFSLLWTGTAAGIIAMLPDFFNRGVFFLIEANFLALGISVITKSVRGVIFVLASFFGISSFLVLWTAMVNHFVQAYPNKPDPITNAANAYLLAGGTLLLYVGCFYAFPLAAFIMWPSDEAIAMHLPHIDWNGILGSAMASRTQRPDITIEEPHETVIIANPPPDYPRIGAPTPLLGEPGHPLSGDVVDGEFTDGTPPQNGGSSDPVIGDADPTTQTQNGGNSQSNRNTAAPNDPVIGDQNSEVITEPSAPPELESSPKRASTHQDPKIDGVGIAAAATTVATVVVTAVAPEAAPVVTAVGAAVGLAAAASKKHSDPVL